MVTDDPIGVGCWRTASVFRRDFSMKRIVQFIEQTFSEVHVSNRVDGFCDEDRAGNLAVPVSPVVLNSLHVPLVDKYDDLVALSVINRSKQILIFIVDKDFLQAREEDLCVLDVPVGACGVHALFGEGRRANNS